MNTVRALIAAAAIAATAASAAAQQASVPQKQAEAIAETRHALFQLIGAAAAPALGLLRGQPYNAETVKLAGVRLDVLGGMIKQLTALDTTKLAPNFLARPNIWTDRVDFEAKADALVATAATLKDTTDEASAKKAAQALAIACRACHDKFRDEKK